MNSDFFPYVLKNIRINESNLYSPNPSALFYSIGQLEIYLKSQAFDNLILALTSCMDIYLEKSININETFNKIKPNFHDFNEEEALYVFKRIASPSSIAWTTYQYLVFLIQNTSNINDRKRYIDKKELIEKSLSTNRRSIDIKGFKKFIYGK